MTLNLIVTLKMVSHLFMSYGEVLNQQRTNPGKNSTVTRRHQASTVAAKFQISLMELVEKMERLLNMNHFSMSIFTYL